MSGPLFALAMCLLAGLCTVIGGAAPFFIRRTNTRLLSAGAGFSAGVMIYISLAHILPEAQVDLRPRYGEGPAGWIVLAAFFGGIALTALIDMIVPSVENPHEVHKIEDIHSPARIRLLRVGMMTSVAMAVHNFPEGMATFFAVLKDPAVGLPIAAAVALHNIPEGISISVPIYGATGSRRKALLYSLILGLCEPAGALLGYGLLSPFLTPPVLGMVLAVAAGTMVFISFDELLPMAHEYGEHHTAVYGLIAGMAVMAAGLILLHPA